MRSFVFALAAVLFASSVHAATQAQADAAKSAMQTEKDAAVDAYINVYSEDVACETLIDEYGSHPNCNSTWLAGFQSSLAAIRPSNQDSTWNWADDLYSDGENHEDLGDIWYDLAEGTSDPTIKASYYDNAIADYEEAEYWYGYCVTPYETVLTQLQSLSQDVTDAIEHANSQ